MKILIWSEHIFKIDNVFLFIALKFSLAQSLDTMCANLDGIVRENNGKMWEYIKERGRIYAFFWMRCFCVCAKNTSLLLLGHKRTISGKEEKQFGDD